MKDKLFVVGDVHGQYDMLMALLKHWDEQTQQLVFLGDLADRGPKSKQVWQFVQQLVEQNRAICLSGNHEDIFLQWLADPGEKLDWYLRNGGQATIEDLLHAGALAEYSPSEAAGFIKSRYPKLISFMEEMPYYYETSYCICVHAGLDLALANWRDTSIRDFLWIREPFHQAKNNTQKYIVFGHTPVQTLHDNVFATHLWIHDNKIGMDGGAVYEGALHGVVISEHGVEADYQIIHPKHRWEGDIQ